MSTLARTPATLGQCLDRLGKPSVRKFPCYLNASYYAMHHELAARSRTHVNNSITKPVSRAGRTILDVRHKEVGGEMSVLQYCGYCGCCLSNTQ